MHIQAHLELGNNVVQLTEFSELNVFSKHVTLEFFKILVYSFI